MVLIFFAFLVRLAGEPRSPRLFFSGWFLVNDSVSSRHAGLFRCCFPSRLSLCRQCVSGNLSISPLFSDLLFPGVSPWYRLSRLFSHCWFYLFPSSVFCGECCVIGPFRRACCTLVPARGRILELVSLLRTLRSAGPGASPGLVLMAQTRGVPPRQTQRSALRVCAQQPALRGPLLPPWGVDRPCLGQLCGWGRHTEHRGSL